MSILKQKRVIQEGDMVILWGGKEVVSKLIVKKGEILNNRRGAFHHDDFIGVEFGSKVKTRKHNGWVYALHPSAEMWTKATDNRTQILYSVDISLITVMLELSPGKVVIESGTGTGVLSIAIARCIFPNGKLYTFEVNKHRAAAAMQDFKLAQLDNIIQVTLRNACEEGFQLQDIADAVFLDLPSPWDALDSAHAALKAGGRLCSFSPCIEQVQRTCEKLRSHKYEDIITLECLLRPYDVKKSELNKFRFQEATEQVPEAEDTMEEEGTEGKKRKREGSEEQEKKRKAPQFTVNQVVLTKPIQDIKGHTGYLTFAKKSIYKESV